MRPSFARVAMLSATVALAASVARLSAQNVPREPAHGETPVAPATPAVPAAPAAPATMPGPFAGQPDAGPPAGAGAAPARPRPDAYPAVRATDPAAVERGRVLYVTTFACAACHAADIRGTDRGNSLLRSPAMMQDAGGELIATATRASRSHRGRYAAITETQYADLAQFMKSFRNIGTGNVEIIRPAVFRAGDPVAGQAYFAANCAACHAVAAGQPSSAANLSRIGARAEPTGMAARNLQQRWLSPSTTKPTMVVVTLGDGQRLTGRATKIDEFNLALTLTDGTAMTIERDGEKPKMEMTYPLAAHAALLRRISDKEIHDVTGYLVTLK